MKPRIKITQSSCEWGSALRVQVTLGEQQRELVIYRSTRARVWNAISWHVEQWRLKPEVGGYCSGVDYSG